MSIVVNSNSSIRFQSNKNFANEGGGRFCYMGKQQIPAEEIAFIPPDNEQYLGQLSDEYNKDYITIQFNSPNIIIKKYNNLDKKTYQEYQFTILNYTKVTAALDDKNARIYIALYHTTNYPTGQIIQYQLDEYNTITQANSETLSSMTTNYNFNNFIAFNHNAYLVINKGETSSSGMQHDYQLIKISNNGEKNYFSFTGTSISLYTNDVSLYWCVKVVTSKKTTYSIYYFLNGELNTYQIIFQKIASYYTYSFQYLKKSDLFLVIQLDSGEVDTRAFFLNSKQEQIELDGRIPSIKFFKLLDVTENYTIITNNSDLLTYVMLISNTDGCIKFADSYCGIGEPPYIRFDEYNNLFYIGSDATNNYEFIYTII